GATAEASISVAVAGNSSLDSSANLNGGYLTGSPAASGSPTTWTYSVWVKGDTTAYSAILSSAGNQWQDQIGFDADGHLRVWFNGATQGFVASNETLTDPDHWYNVVVAFDSTQANASD
ncbi:unnamed protein product, partial [Chrysoparadoxa australica]